MRGSYNNNNNNNGYMKTPLINDKINLGIKHCIIAGNEDEFFLDPTQVAYNTEDTEIYRVFKSTKIYDGLILGRMHIIVDNTDEIIATQCYPCSNNAAGNGVDYDLIDISVLEKYQKKLQLYDKFPNRLGMTNDEYNAEIIQQCLRAIPVGNILKHTKQNLPNLVSAFIKENCNYYILIEEIEKLLEKFNQ